MPRSPFFLTTGLGIMDRRCCAGRIASDLAARCTVGVLNCAHARRGYGSQGRSQQAAISRLSPRIRFAKENVQGKEMINGKRIAVVMPAFNASKTLEKTFR